MEEVITMMQNRIEELETKLVNLTALFMEMSELYVDTSKRLRQYEEMDKVKRIEKI